MHETTVTASSVRKDGKGFKATLPEYGEVWLSLPDSMAGAVEWKKTYDVAFNVKEGTRGNFYNVTKIEEHGAPALAPSSAPASNGGTAPLNNDVGPHIGMWEKEVFDGLRAGMTSSQIILLGIEARRAARIIVRADLDAKLPEFETLGDPSDSLEF